jgi:hypothetical protein
MSTTYRAAYYLNATSANASGLVLTLPEHASMTDDALKAEAADEARRAGLIGTDRDAGQVSETEFSDCLHIGDWTE